MSEDPTSTPTEQPAAQPTVQPPPKAQPTYTQEELAAEAVALGCYPWDVAGVFKMKNVDAMTEEEFNAALAEWRAPLPGEAPPPEGSN